MRFANHVNYPTIVFFQRIVTGRRDEQWRRGGRRRGGVAQEPSGRHRALLGQAPAPGPVNQ